MSYTAVLEEINKTCLEKGRKVGDVTLLAVSKMHEYSEVLQAYKEGSRLFGENHVQEIVSKFPIDKPSDMKVFLIGHLQSNKVRKVLPLIERIESVDSLPLLTLIEKECARIEKKLDILFEINSSGEEQKTGFRTEEELVEALKAVKACKWVRLIGFMTVGPLGSDKDKNKQAFKSVKILYDKYKTEDFSVLSMGMSGDFSEAIEEGSTECRIGTAIFGHRDYGKTSN